nr:glucose-6-phosphate isomerase [Caldimonas sp.]
MVAAPTTTWTRCDRTAAWAALAGHWQAHGRDFDLREAFAGDAGRFASLSFDAPEVFCDLSKNLLDVATLRFLVDLANECGLEAQRDAMLAGAAINTTEGRAVLHTALRAPRGAAPYADEVHGVLDAMLEFAEAVRRRADAPAPGAAPLRHVVNIGIGGSDLGPRMAVRALAHVVHPRLAFHFVANVDGDDLATTLAGLRHEETLFVVASKT